MSPDLLKPALLCVFAVLVIVAALKDLSTYTIPNWVSGVLALAFVPAVFAAGAHPLQIGLAVLIGLVMLGVGVAMFALGWLGGGDAKLMAAASLWLGLQGLGPFVLFTGLAGGALALLLLGMRSAWVRPFAASGPPWVDRLATPGAAAPYGVAIAIGALAALPSGLVMRAVHAGL
jgi:prepilin peptidase CpaA